MVGHAAMICPAMPTAAREMRIVYQRIAPRQDGKRVRKPVRVVEPQILGKSPNCSGAGPTSNVGQRDLLCVLSRWSVICRRP